MTYKYFVLQYVLICIVPSTTEKVLKIISLTFYIKAIKKKKHCLSLNWVGDGEVQ